MANLHFHDLRHEAGSRLHEAGMPLHHVKEMLGHASLDQTTTYLNVQIEGLQASMRQIDEARRCKPVANVTSEGTSRAYERRVIVAINSLLTDMCRQIAPVAQQDRAPVS